MNLYLRLLLTWLGMRLKPPIRLGDTIEMTMRVWPGDLDVNGHMNNGRYLTITDLIVVEYFGRAGFFRIARRKGWLPMLGGAMVSFRHALKPFRRYTLRTTMACWDERWSYFRFEFLQDGKTMAAGHLKGAIIGRSGIVSSTETRAALGSDPASPAFPGAISAWIEADRLTRAAMER
ncbi:MAG: thioesterase family protein [Pseudomonadota bacterium]